MKQTLTHDNTLINNPHAVETGRVAEKIACEFLENKGLILMGKNYSVHNVGEIDLIMRDKKHIVFVEVKSRQHADYGHVLEMISKSKQARIIRTAQYYLIRQHLWNVAFCRFDVMGIVPDKKNPKIQQITWIKNAFEVQ